MVNKQRYDYKFLTKFCEENRITLLKSYENEKITRETIIEAKCINCENRMKKNLLDCL